MGKTSASRGAGGFTGRSRWLAALAILALLALVALSVRAHYSLGPSGAPNQGLGADLMASLVQVVLVVSIAAFELIVVAALVVAPWRRLRQAGKKGPPLVRFPRRSLLAMAALPFGIVVGLGVLLVVLLKRRPHPLAVTRPGIPRGSGLSAHLVTKVATVTVSEATVLAAAVGLILLAALLVARVRSRRRRALATAQPSLLSEELTEALDESLVELGLGADPRQAVITAYERMQAVLTKVGLGPEPFETPLEYLERALGRLNTSRRALVRLTELFETARFSVQAVDLGMRNEAETALSGLRAELAG
ncbi:MAG: DUF4129 domain-containing protein [Candidatus Dormiibacterota bacterium]